MQNPRIDADDDSSISTPKKTPKKKRKLREVLDNFFRHSTLPLVNLVYKKINIIWKFLWFLVVVTGLTIFIYESVELLKNYLKYPSFMTNMEKINRSFYFPSVTLCPTNIVNWEEVLRLNHSIQYIIEEELAKLRQNNETELQLMEKIFFVLINKLQAMDSGERNDILNHYQDWLHAFMTYDEDYHLILNDKNYIKSSYSPYYGVCVTLNPGMTEETKLRVTTMNNFFIVAEIKKEIEFPHLLEPSGFYLSLHTPGSAPVLLILKKIIIHPGEILQISVDTTDIQRLPPPYASQCVEDKTPPTEFTSTYSPYTSGETPYSYSRAECIASCVFNHTLEELGCCWPEVIVNETYQSRKIPLCFPGENHDKILEIDKTCTKECRNRCREFLYNWSSKTSIITTHHSKLLKTISKTIDQLKSKTDPQPMMKEAENSSNFVILMMNMESSTFMYSEETARYELEDIFGSIGGNLGLWIGLSILSAFEVFELLTNIVVYFVCKLFKREINI